MPDILVVDDDADMRLALRNVLVRDGHRVQEAGDGETAIGYASTHAVDLVLLDIRLPGLDGVQTLRRLKELRRELPVVMITGYGSVETAVELMKLGANRYLQKPFDNQQLVEVVAQTLAAPVGGDTGILRRSLLAKIGLAPETTPSPAAEKTAPPAPPAPPRGLRPPAAPAAKTAPPSPPPKKRRSINLFPPFFGLLAIAAGYGLWLFITTPSVDNRDFALLGKNPSGLSWTGDGLWVSDWAAQTVTLYDHGLQAVRTVKLEGVHPTGVAVCDKFMFVSDSWRKMIERRRLDDELTLEVAKPSPGPSPSGLFCDGKKLWAADSEEGHIYQLDPITLAPELFNPTAGKAPIGLFVAGDSLWSADAETRMVYRHSVEPGLPLKESLLLPELSAGQEPVSAFSFHDRHFWLARDGVPRVLKRHPSAFQPK